MLHGRGGGAARRAPCKRYQAMHCSVAFTRDCRFVGSMRWGFVPPGQNDLTFTPQLSVKNQDNAGARRVVARPPAARGSGTARTLAHWWPA